MQRGELWWANLPDPQGSVAGYRRPVVVIQADAFTASRIATVVVLAIRSNLRLATAPGNVFVSAQDTSLTKDSVINVSQIITLDKTMLDQYIGILPRQIIDLVDQGVRLVLEL